MDNNKKEVQKYPENPTNQNEQQKIKIYNIKKDFDNLEKKEKKKNQILILILIIIIILIIMAMKRK